MMKGAEAKGFGLSYHMQEEGPNEAGDGAVGEGLGLSEEDESRINVPEGVNDGCGGGNDGPVHEAMVHKSRPQPQQQRQHQHWQQQPPVLQPPPPPPPPPCPVVLWESFLPVRSLKVLLVENDDSTRQVVSALLRNCCYEVTAVANGLEAWKVLEDFTNHIDIVLTEVVMPCLSGIGLLGKIMNHKTCQNIPVIMMSSHDSMGIVFKCLSKGAVDFLVKPIRKNELKNLWQHVWRRCHSSSGSGSESGIRTQKSVKSKNVDDSDNNTGSNDEDDNASIGLDTRDDSDNGSGTQSLWTKHVAEPDSPQPSSPWNRLGEAPGSTCAQVIHAKPETFGNDWLLKSCSENQEQMELLDDGSLQRDSEMCMPRDTDIQPESLPSRMVSANPSRSKNDNTKKNCHQSDDIAREVDGSHANCELTIQAADLIGTMAKDSMVTASAQASNSVPKNTENKEKDVVDAKELPLLELSLKRLRSMGGCGVASNDHRYVLRRSDQSAFSRYGASAASSLKPTVYGGSCSALLDDGSDAVEKESIYNMQPKQNTAPVNGGSHGGCNINDMGSTTNNIFSKPEAFNENVSSSSTIKGTSAFHPIKQQNYATQCAVPENTDIIASTKVMEELKGTHQLQVQHHHHHYHHYHHHVHVGKQPLQQVQPPSDHDELKNIAAAAPPCGSCNMFSGAVEANVGNCSINGSTSGSNNGSNGQNRSSAMNPGGAHMESENGLIGKNEGGCSGSGSGSGSAVDQNRSAQRVAALTKFRQKRKQRCFQKKVRYQSRKKLAEQRPRVRGQFVRQIIQEHTNRETNC